VNVIRRMYRGESNFDVLRHSRQILYVTVALLGVCVLSLVVRGLNLGIEFEGGVVWELPGNGVSEDAVRATLSDFGLADARIQVIGGSDYRIRAQAEAIGTQTDTTDALAELVGVPPSEVSVTEVGPSWGKEITSKAERALIVFILVITLYLTLRFEWKMAAAALIALAHDVLLSVGVYSIFQLEVTPATVIAFLTIMGYSLYDTIVVFDRVSETTRLLPARSRTTYRAIVNASLNQVLMRSINTSITSLAPVVALLVVGSFMLGAVSLQEFAVALLVGMLAGAYSSIFIASPLLVPMKEREPQWAMRRRSADTTGGDDVIDADQLAAAAQYARSTPPRPRKRGRRR
jgi:preprotein translocase subunit SecF